MMNMNSKAVSNIELFYEISNLLNYEAHLLDNRRFEEWLDMLDENIIYRMPLRVTRENKDGSNIVNDMAFFEENKQSLTVRVNRLRTTSAWAEDPAPRTRHFVSNMMIESIPNENEVQIRSNFLFKRSRAGDIVTEEIFGERLDVLQKVDYKWKIVSRTIYPDQSVLTIMNLSMFL